MKTISIIIAAITALLLLSTLICGLWISKNSPADAGSLKFHMQISIASVLFGLATVVLLIIQSLNR